MVVNISDDRADLLLHALSSTTRRQLLAQAMDGRQSVSALARLHPMSITAIQKHVAVLEEAGLVTRHREGRETLVRSSIEGIRDAQRLLDQLEVLWRGRMDRFGEVLAEQPDKEEARP